MQTNPRESLANPQKLFLKKDGVDQEAARSGGMAEKGH